MSTVVSLRCEGGPHHGRVLTLDAAAEKAVLPPAAGDGPAGLWRTVYVRDGGRLLFQDHRPRAAHWLPDDPPGDDDESEV